ncbi:MAG: carbonic anhydrase [Rhodospirillales bacterium]|jgi:carbonic anhydrase|nr:carbonic anhydrase [Rhodospirillales bacterium]
MAVKELVDGFGKFRERFFEQDPALFSDLVENGQHPKVAIVACADSRVSPSVLLQASPGSLFVIRNVANMVPPPIATAGNATIAGLEYAVLGLGVEHIVVLGHSHCGGIHALIEGPSKTADTFPHVTEWVSAFEPARRQALAELGEAGETDTARCMEKAAIAASLENLRGYPWVSSRLDAGTLRLHGWYFELAAGKLSELDQSDGAFATLVG